MIFLEKIMINSNCYTSGTSLDDSNRSTSKTLSHKLSRNYNINKGIRYDNVITKCNNDLNNSVSENFRPLKR